MMNVYLIFLDLGLIYPTFLRVALHLFRFVHCVVCSYNVLYEDRMIDRYVCYIFTCHVDYEANFRGVEVFLCAT